MLVKLLCVAVGGGLGAICRFLLGGWVQSLYSGRFPLGIFLVNILGCLLIGIAYSLLIERSLVSSKEIQLAVITGFLGGFTTFSTYGLDIFQLLRSAHYVQAVLYAGGSMIAGLLALCAGYYIARIGQMN